MVSCCLLSVVPVAIPIGAPLIFSYGSCGLVCPDGRWKKYDTQKSSAESVGMLHITEDMACCRSCYKLMLRISEGSQTKKLN
jgi:hypothetical protein